MNQCKWITHEQKKCTNSVLMDGYCTRHLKQKCSVCWEEVPSTNSGNHKRLKCGHSFHFKCIIQWFKTSDNCPVCRKEQTHDTVIEFKHDIENKMRILYRDAIRSLEKENAKLRRNMTR